MTIYGWDMSHYDAPSLGTALAEGIAFITHKAGGDALDAELDDWWAGVRGLPVDEVLLGAYWVLYPGNPAGRADAFLARLDAACGGWRDRPFILQVDCERWGGDQGTVPSRADIRAFCDRLVDRMPRLRPIVYAPEWVYGDTLAGLDYPLWASSYVSGAGGFRSLYPGDASSRWGAYSGQVPAILQYSSKATIGGQTTCDANAFRGTLQQLTALVAPGWEDDMPSIDDVRAVVRAELAAAKDDIAAATWAHPLDIDVTSDGVNMQPAGGILRYNDTRANRSDNLVKAATAKIDAVGTRLGLTAAELAAFNAREAAEVPATPGETARAVLDALAADSPEQTAAALAAVLGGRASDVGRILAGL